ncbi:hypothetical protein OP10G_3912 [Fimbriimonas ginsengisoli Gsoil 348]|uniref:Uncharacterized protein n=2 Tax=Fimbriimonas ginsengisoli TaxID=1005039 RepID=A0A068NWX2_FIMGI|nr:hypothetical protein OP10G_3912 [Fimbriimonas ginsengisoli Gsoil 348]
MLRLLAAAISFAAVCLASAQIPDIRRDFVLLEKDAVGLLAPRVASGAYSESIKWSSDGAYLMINQLDMGSVESILKSMASGTPPSAEVEPQRQIVFFSTKGYKTKSVVPITGAGIKIQTLEWLPNSSQAIVQYMMPRLREDGTVEDMDDVVSLISAGDGKVRPLAKSEPNTSLSVEISPNTSRFAITRTKLVVPTPGSGEHPAMRSEIQFGSSDGSLSPFLKLPHSYSEFRWGADGAPYVCIREISKKHAGVDTTWFRIDGRTGATTPATEPAWPSAPAAKVVNALSFEFKMPVPKKVDGDVPNIRAVVIVPAEGKGEHMAFASSDGVQGLVSPAGDAVAYIHHGVALVRPLIHVSKDAYLQALAAAKRVELLSNAKQAGLALIMFGADNDDKLPGVGDNFLDKINPYVKNPSLLNGFVFSLAGADLSKVDNPASTELGYIPGPGGRAVVYADGHAKWIPNP